ncbi:MAG: TIGR00282 family metallophosphoesterase [Ruminococcaceae bacterium]|nr:TIGR00282 family metallophosphoesterase [Oscillospiraceae bacterium]
MRILAVGDVTGESGLEFIRSNLKYLKQDENIDFCIVNGENAAVRNGITPKEYEVLIQCGADVVTLGNHTFDRGEIKKVLTNSDIIRPANYPEGTDGSGSTVISVGNKRIGIINLLGNVNSFRVDCPFKTADMEIEKLKDKCDMIFVDFHAEATSEKLALAFYLDGRVTGIFGTHTHVQTADERIMPRGTGYITDLGMTGVVNSVLGVDKDIIIERFRTSMPVKFQPAYGSSMMCGVIFETDDDTDKCKFVKRVRIE